MWATLLLFSGTAFAHHWSWGETPRRYLIEMETQTPYIMWLLQEANKEGRVSYAATSVLMNCAVRQVLPKDRGWLIQCPVEDASFFAVALMEDQGRADAVVLEAEKQIEGSTVTFKQSREGAVSGIRLEGLDVHDPRSAFIAGQVERLVERAVVALDVPMPAEDAVQPQWVVKNFSTAKMPLTDLLTGSIKAISAWGEPTAEGVTITTEASGTLAVSEELWSIRASGTASFDPVAGCLTSNLVGVNSEPGSNNIGANRVRFRMRAAARLVEAGAVVELVPSKGW